MNSFFPILNWAGLLLLKEKLSHCTPYQEAERDSRAQWAAFKASHPEALNEEVLDLLDRCQSGCGLGPRRRLLPGTPVGPGAGRPWPLLGYGAAGDDTPVWRDSVGPAGGMTRKQLSKTAT